MVELGWSHADLEAMDEPEFQFWCQETLERKEAEAKATREAAREARKGSNK